MACCWHVSCLRPLALAYALWLASLWASVLVSTVVLLLVGCCGYYWWLLWLLSLWLWLFSRVVGDSWATPFAILVTTFACCWGQLGDSSRDFGCYSHALGGYSRAQLGWWWLLSLPLAVLRAPTAARAERARIALRARPILARIRATRENRIFWLLPWYLY
jgi:hypothetical protein